MATVRQELGQGRGYFEDHGVGDVQSYIEKIEKKSEVVTDQAAVPSRISASQVSVPASGDMAAMVAQSIQQQGKPQIVLPMTEEELRNGLHYRVVDGVRWLAEWCQMMIKKYPGRVFYPIEV